MDLSIIIPVYNVEHYVSQCVFSILNQNIKDCKIQFEVIFINDGSTDNSINIIEPLIKEHDNCYILNQENQGLSVARNHGIDKANGDYLWFIDSDDWIFENSLKLIYSKLLDSPDAVVMSALNKYNDGRNICSQDMSKFRKQSYNGYDLLKEDIGIACVPYTIIKKQIIINNKLKMLPGIYHEDLEFLPRVYSFLNDIRIVPETLYYHRMVSTSITHQLNFKKNTDLIKVALSLNSFKHHNVDKRNQPLFSNIICLALNNSCHNYYKMPIKKRKEIGKCLADNRDLLNNMLYSNKLKYHIEWFFLFFFRSSPILFYRVINRL